jgi:uncharacterized hydrophobic protein (TIGR00341 family)
VRLIQIRVSATSREEIVATLDEENIQHVLVEEGGDDGAAIVYFPLPNGAVEKVMDRLREAGLDEDTFTIIMNIESATTPTFDELESQYTQGPDDEVGLSHASLRENAREVTPGRLMFVTFAALSAIVATSGLLLNSAIVIVGSMVISPFAGSSLAASVGAVIGDYDSILDSFKSQLLGLSVAIVSATVAAAVVRWSFLVPSSLAVESISQINAFSIPIVLTFVIAIFAGTAGALALATDLDVSLAGVAVAAAIVPAAAAVGLGIVWLKPLLATGALVLLLMNLLLINVSAFVALTLFGYRAPSSTRLRDHVSVSPATVAYAVGGVVVLVVLGWAVASTTQYLLFVETTNHDVQDVVDREQYDQLELLDVQTDYVPYVVGASDSSGTVTVVASRSAGRTYPHLSAVLHRTITRDSDRPVTVQVRFVDYQRTGPNATSADLRAHSAAAG